ncbi:MAG TPA: hypothetical protein VGG12_04365 [Methylovirgula sp.]
MVSVDRLKFLSPNLARQLNSAPIEKRRAAGIIACEFAAKAAAIHDPLAIETLRRLQAGQPLTAQQRADLESKAAATDSRYLDEQAAVDQGNASDCSRAFAVARAWAALSCASSDSVSATSEAIYEAAAAMGDERAHLFAAIESSLA